MDAEADGHNDEATSSRDPAYFSYYALLTHQQNMLQDTVRTSTYRQAILANAQSCFLNKIVLDVGAGSGILSYFSVQAGAKKVYAVEASNMADRMKKVISEANLVGVKARNAFLKDKVEVVHSKIEDPRVSIPKVDTIISEPIGVFLIHERMLESFLYARDHYLKPNGVLFPSAGTIRLAPFSDAGLYTETITKARFWEQDSFHGVDISVLYPDAFEEMFGMPVVGTFDHRTLMASSNYSSHLVDFTTVTNEDLLEFSIPIEWKAKYTGLVHGIAGWFDLSFIPPAGQGQIVDMSTGPEAERTHWQQVRFLFQEPLAVNCGQTIIGKMCCVVNDHRSYTIKADITTDATLPGTSQRTPFSRHGKWQLHEQTYNYSYGAWPNPEFKPEHNGLYTPQKPQINEIVLDMEA